MKTRIRICIAAMTLSILLAFAFAGCSNKSGNTIDEPEITADYLIEDYSQQLITDGGENMLGHVTMEKTGDTYAVHFSEREVVPSTEYKEGYYIADTNVTVDGTLGLDAYSFAFTMEKLRFPMPMTSSNIRMTIQKGFIQYIFSALPPSSS